MILPTKGDIIVEWEPGDGQLIRGVLPFLVTVTKESDPSQYEVGYILCLSYIDVAGLRYNEDIFSDDIMTIMKRGDM